MKTTPIPVKFDRQGHSCNFYGGFGPTSPTHHLSGIRESLLAAICRVLGALPAISLLTFLWRTDFMEKQQYANTFFGLRVEGEVYGKLTWLVLGGDPAARSHRVEQFTAL